MDSREIVRAEANSATRRAWARFWAHRPARFATVGLALTILLALTSPQWWPVPPDALHAETFAAPSGVHWLGTDANGRDMLSRLCAGTRVSLGVGIAGAGFSLFLGVLVGGVAGYVGGRWDEVLMRGVDLLYSMPSVILVMVLMAVFRDPMTDLLRPWMGAAGDQWSSTAVVVVGLGSVSWLNMARIVRGHVRGLTGQAYIEAARALGMRQSRILIHHVLPNAAGVILTALTLTLPTVVLGESFLSFLGLGIQPPSASLGSLLAEGAGQINPIRTYWWLLLSPTVILVLLLVGIGYLGDGVREALDPKDSGDAKPQLAA